MMSLFILSTYAQVKGNGCGTHLTPKESDVFLKSAAQFKQKAFFSKKANNAEPYIIPVVFHILHNGEGKVSRSDMKCRIDDVMLTINGDYNGTFPGYNQVDPRFRDIRDKMNIKFVLATKDPNGRKMEVPGMDWQAESANIAYGYDRKIYDYIWFGRNNTYYADIVVVNEPNDPGGTTGSGHAFLPTQNVVPHIAFNWRYVGSTCGSFSRPGFEKVMTHEFGHYFGLRHTFQGSCSNGNDGIDDTPPTPGSEGCERNKLNSCGVYANLENHMDYNTSCQNMYTKDQVARQTYWLEDNSEAPYPRRSLWQQKNLEKTGVIAGSPVADFSSDKTNLCAGDLVSFIDASTNFPTSYKWTFEGGSPSTSSDKQPKIRYNSGGTYRVTLTVQNQFGTDTETKNAYISVNLSDKGNVFESFAGQFPPKGWFVTNPDSSFTFEKRSDVGNGDASSMIMNNADNSVLGTLDYITLTSQDFTSAKNATMSFDVAYTKFDDNSPDVLKVQFSRDCGKNWFDVYSKTHTELQTVEVPTEESNDWVPKNSSDWRTENVKLNNLDGEGDVLIRFYNKSGYGTRIWIDNVKITKVTTTDPDICGEDDLPKGTVTSTDETAANANDGAITITFADNPNRSQIQFSINDGTSYSYQTNDNAKTYTISNLTPGNYTVWSRWSNEECPIELKTVTIKASAPVVDSYCVPKHTFPRTRYIKSIRINDFENVSGQSSNGYSNYTNKNIALESGRSYAFNLQSNDIAFASYAKNNMAAWIDFNQNGIFEAGEKVVDIFATSSLASSNQYPTTNVSISSSLPNGSYRFRVRHSWISNGNSASPCRQQGEGEVEDYTIVINGGNVTTPETGKVVYVDLLNDPTASQSNDWDFFRIETGDDRDYGAWFANNKVYLTTYNKAIIVDGSSDNAALLSENQLVGSQSNFDTTPSRRYLISSDTYSALNGRSGYIGFQFKVNGETHYGWFYIEVANNGKSYTIKDYAYNTVANAPLRTTRNGIKKPSQENKEQLQVTAFPNPFADYSTIRLNEVSLRLTAVLVYDISGKLVEKQMVTEDVRTIKIGSTISTPGIYFVQLKSETNIQTIKIQKE